MTAAQEHATAQFPPQSSPPIESRGITVECVVYRAGRVYRAVCLDLGLIVERPAFDDAAGELMALIRTYLQDARDVGMAGEELLRPVPRSERLYVYCRVMAALAAGLLSSFSRGSRRRFSGGRGKRFQYITCPV